MNATERETEEQAVRRDVLAREFAERLQGYAARTLHRADLLDDSELGEIGKQLMDVRTELVILRPSAFLPITGDWPWQRSH